MKKELAIKISAGTMIAVIVISLTLLFMGKMQNMHFWIIVIIAALMAYVLIPWIKKQS